MAAAAYGLADAAMLGLIGLRDGLASSGIVDSLVGLGAMVLVVTACAHLGRLRHEVHRMSVAEPAVADVLAARARRDRARALVEQDPLMARELRIGRPDLAQDYDDGGLVDLAGAPVELIAQVCDLAADDAERIVAARGCFSSIDELLVLVDLPIGVWGRIRDRAVVILA